MLFYTIRAIIKILKLIKREYFHSCNKKLRSAFSGTPVRAVWNDEKSKWYFSILDIISAIRTESSYEKSRNYWKYLKAKLKRENSRLVSVTTQLKLTAKDGKQYMFDALDAMKRSVVDSSKTEELLDTSDFSPYAL